MGARCFTSQLPFTVTCITEWGYLWAGGNLIITSNLSVILLALIINSCISRSNIALDKDVHSPIHVFRKFPAMQKCENEDGTSMYSESPRVDSSRLLKVLLLWRGGGENSSQVLRRTPSPIINGKLWAFWQFFISQWFCTTPEPACEPQWSSRGD